jgi:hypothetical protein
MTRAWLRRGAGIALCAGLVLAGGCSAAPAQRAPQASDPLPPDPEAITVFGRYQPSLESLAPPGVEIGDLAVRDGRLVIHVQADTGRAATAFERALRTSGWYHDPRREPVEPGALRDGAFVLSVQPAP